MLEDALRHPDDFYNARDDGYVLLAEALGAPLVRPIVDNLVPGSTAVLEAEQGVPLALLKHVREVACSAEQPGGAPRFELWEVEDEEEETLGVGSWLRLVVSEQAAATATTAAGLASRTQAGEPPTTTAASAAAPAATPHTAPTAASTAAPVTVAPATTFSALRTGNDGDFCRAAVVSKGSPPAPPAAAGAAEGAASSADLAELVQFRARVQLLEGHLADLAAELRARVQALEAREGTVASHAGASSGGRSVFLAPERNLAKILPGWVTRQQEVSSNGRGAWANAEPRTLNNPETAAPGETKLVHGLGRDRQRMRGRLRTFSTEKGYGFIACAGVTGDVYVHVNAFAGELPEVCAGYADSPALGQEVEFTLLSMYSRLRASRAVVVGAALPRPKPVAGARDAVRPMPSARDGGSRYYGGGPPGVRSWPCAGPARGRDCLPPDRSRELQDRGLTEPQNIGRQGPSTSGPDLAAYDAAGAKTMAPAAAAAARRGGGTETRDTAAAGTGAVAGASTNTAADGRGPFSELAQALATALRHTGELKWARGDGFCMLSEVLACPYVRNISEKLSPGSTAKLDDQIPTELKETVAHAATPGQFELWDDWIRLVEGAEGPSKSRGTESRDGGRDYSGGRRGGGDRSWPAAGPARGRDSLQPGRFSWPDGDLQDRCGPEPVQAHDSGPDWWKGNDATLARTAVDPARVADAIARDLVDPGPIAAQQAAAEATGAEAPTLAAPAPATLAAPTPRGDGAEAEAATTAAADTAAGGPRPGGLTLPTTVALMLQELPADAPRPVREYVRGWAHELGVA